MQIAILVAARGNRFWPLVAQEIVAALLGAVVLVYSGADAGETLPTHGERIARIVDRAWMIILLDLAIGLGQTFALAQAVVTPDLPTQLLSMALFFLIGMLLYAEPYVAQEPELNPWWALGFSLMRSMMLAWVNMRRVANLVALQLVAAAVTYMTAFATLHSALLSDATNAVQATIQTVLFDLLYIAAYLQTLREERETTM